MILFILYNRIFHKTNDQFFTGIFKLLFWADYFFGEFIPSVENGYIKDIKVVNILVVIILTF